ncbi:outer dynein arm-docking complex subunit 4-like [Tubulanus polymorphus]|uniref:outer dynein arm-docking complex subunit 4-like n=1 Tax=Tubulanus polymorphus TaxID=672921 RepID=UPI003DA4F602
MAMMMMMYDEIDSSDDASIRGNFQGYFAEGESLYQHRDYEKAAQSYTTALEFKPLDRECLVARSKCWLQIGEVEKALSDAEESLCGENKTYHKGLYQKAEVLYSMGEFELALVFYHRGHKLRPELSEFRLGIQKAQEAITNACGCPQKLKLTKDGDLSFYKQHKNDNARSFAVYASAMRSHHNSRANTTSRHRSTTGRDVKPAENQKTVETLLGEMYGDKLFLEKLLSETSKVSIVKGDYDGKIQEAIKDGLRYLDSRTEFWRQQKPIYARRFERQDQRRQFTVPGSHQCYAITEIERIDQALEMHQPSEALKRARACLKTAGSWTLSQCPRLPEIRANLHSLIGNAYLEMDNFKLALFHHRRDREISSQICCEEGLSRSLDNIGRVFARCGQFEQAITVWEEKKPLVKGSLEQAWISHELGRCYLELKDFDSAKTYGEKALLSAREAGDNVWCMNAWVLLAQSHVRLQDYGPAVEAFEEALRLAKLLEDCPAIQAISCAVDQLNKSVKQCS